MQKINIISRIKKSSTTFIIFFILLINSSCNQITPTSELIAGNFASAPEITWLYPKQSSDGFPVNGSILFSATLPVDLAQIQSNGILKDEFGSTLPVSVQSTGTYGFKIFPLAPLTINTRYTYTIPTGTQAIGSKFTSDQVLSFSTLAILQPVTSSFGTATDGTTTYVFLEGTTSNNASITFSKAVTGVAISATSLHIETDTGCMNCATISGLSGSGAGPYTFTINGINSGVVYFLRMGPDIKDADGNSAASSIKFAVAPVVTMVKNLGSRGILPNNTWGVQNYPPVVTIDPNGNRYVAGTFFGSADWGGGVRTSNSTFPSLFVIKYNSAGNYVWDRVWSPGSVILPESIKADATGVYIMGDYICGGALTLDTGVTLPGTAVGGWLETFLIKIDSVSSVATWADNFNSGTTNNGSTALEFTPDNKLAVVVYGYASTLSSMTVSPAAPACSLPVATGSYIFGINPADGSCAWPAGFPVSLNLTSYWGYFITSIGFDANYMYLTGSFLGLGTGTTLSVAGTVTPPNNYFGGKQDIFVARIGYTAGTGPDATVAAGSWMNNFGTPLLEAGISLAVDQTNSKLYVGGGLHGPLDFGCSVIPCTSVGSAGTEDGFLLAFNTASSVPLWAKTIGGTGGDDRVQKVFVNNGRVRVFSKYAMTIANLKTNQFGCAFNNFNGFGNSDLVMSIYDANGNFDGARAFGSPADEKLFEYYYYILGNYTQGSYIAQDSTGKMTAALYMGSGIIDTFPVISSTNPWDIVMWDLQ